MEQRQCPVCREWFTPTTHNQRFCPPQDGRIRSKCADAYRNAKSRGTLAKLLAEPRTVGVPFGCAECGRRCVPGENVAVNATKFCDAACKKVWHGAHSDAPSYSIEATRRYSLNARRAARRRKKDEALLDPSTWTCKVMEWRTIVRNDPCAYCGASPSNGIDHIEPTMGTGDRSDWSNWTGCCKACNEAKNTLPMLLALQWIPLCRRYHDTRRTLFADRRPPLRTP